MVRKLSAILGALSVVMCVCGVSAQTITNGVVTRDRATVWRADASVPIGVVREGTMLQVTGASEHWYEIVVPRVIGGRGERGLISRALVRLDPGDPQPPLKALRGDPAPGSGLAGPTVGRPRASASAVRKRSVPLFPRGFVAIGGAYQTSTSAFADTVTFQANAEDGHFTTKYAIQHPRGFSASGGAMLSRIVGVGVTVDRVSGSIPTTFDAAIPHPFFFNDPRNVAADIGGIDRDELGVHAQIRAAVPVTSRVDIAAFGGPSWFHVRQDVVSDFKYADQYPYDQAVFQSAVLNSRTASRVGYNVGGDVAVFVTKQVGVGVGVTFSRATIDLPIDASSSVSSHAGGLHVSAGVRFRF